MLRWVAGAIALGLGLAPASAPAWNARGHMTVAAIAWEKMDPEARRRAAELLRLNPDHADWMSPRWMQGMSQAERDRFAFMEASTWPDALRGRTCSRRNPPPCIRDDRYTPPDPEQDLNIGYRDTRLRRYWHFKTLGFSSDGTPVQPAFRANAETQINSFATSLGTAGLGDEAKSFNLAWLLHLVGDVHQPLHATSRFTAGDSDGDSGGNGVYVCKPAPAHCETNPDNRPSSLHGLWDDAIGTSSSVRSALTKALQLVGALSDSRSFLARQVAQADLDATPEDWLVESQALARSYAYADPIGPYAGRAYFPTAGYRSNAGSVAEQRIAIAGLRLARMLNRQLR